MEFKRKVIAKFQEQDCKLSLRDGIEEFYQVNAHLFCKPEPKTPWTELLVSHDVGHVFFGVNTSIMDEAAGDFWSLLGTDMKFKDYAKYAATPEGKKLIQEIGFFRILKTLFYSLPLLVKIFIRSRKMKKPWEHKNYSQYLDSKLGALRKEFGLQIL